jgi:tetratricopeptide (TPR) repeat protein
MKIVPLAILLCVAVAAAEPLPKPKSLESATPEEKEKFQAHIAKLKKFIDEGKKLAEKKKYKEAVQAFSDATQHEPFAMDGFFYLGNTLHIMGEIEAATEAYRRVTELAPESAQGHSNLGVCLTDAGKHDEAIEAHHGAHKLDPKAVKVLVNLANAYLSKNTKDSVKKAGEYFKAALVEHPTHAGAKMGLELAEMGVATEIEKADGLETGRVETDGVEAEGVAF